MNESDESRTERPESRTVGGQKPPQLGLREDGKPAVITEEELLQGYGGEPDGSQVDANGLPDGDKKAPWWAAMEQSILEKVRPQMELLSRALALQGAYMAVLQRVLVRIAAGQAKLGAAEDVAKAMAEGAEQLKAESARLASAGYQETITDFLQRFDKLREDLGSQSP